MGNKFILSCESTVDMPYSYVTGRNISVLFYSYSIDGVEFEDEMGKDPNALVEFYKKIDNGALPSTSQINEYKYLDYFDTLLQKGDVLHIAFGSGMTPSVNNAYVAAEQMREKYPGEKLLERLQEHDVTFWRTDVNGDITFTFSNDEMTVSSQK